MSEDNKIKYEMELLLWTISAKENAPIHDEMREYTISALDKFHKEQRTKMSDIERIIDERSFNYYFAEESIVELDERVIGNDGTFSFISKNVRQPFTFPKLEFSYIGKSGIVKRCYSNLHTFGRGYLYQVDVDFDGDLCKGLPAYYLVENQNKSDVK